jgi:hypothetical protein
MAVGTAVVLCDQAGAGPLVTSAELDRLRPLNFGIRTLRHPVAVDHLVSQIELYDPADAAEVSRRLRAVAGIEEAVDRMTALYEEVLAEHRRKGNPPATEESRAAAAYLRWLSPYIEERSQFLADREGWKAQAFHWNAQTSQLLAEREEWNAQSLAERAGLDAEAAHLRREVQALQSTATWRLRERLLRLTPLRRAYRWVRGVGSR